MIGCELLRVEVAVGDVEDRSSLAGAVDGVEAAYYLIHLMGSGRDFVERDRRAALNFADAAAALVPDGPLGPESWKAFVAAVKDKTGAKGKGLFMPLRQALTGLDHGPEMDKLFVLIGAEKAKKRLQGETA